MDDSLNIIQHQTVIAILFVTKGRFVGSDRQCVVSLKGDRLPTRKPAPCLTWRQCSQLWVVYFIYSKNYIIT